MSKHFLDPQVKRQKTFWRHLGFDDLLVMKYTNRAGSLSPASTCQENSAVQVANDVHCLVPFWSTFVGMDGGYYLCSHDFRKLRCFGNVEHDTVATAWRRKQQYFATDGAVCRSCTANPRCFVPGMQREKTVAAMLQEHAQSHACIMERVEHEIRIDLSRHRETLIACRD